MAVLASLIHGDFALVLSLRTLEIQGSFQAPTMWFESLSCYVRAAWSTWGIHCVGNMINCHVRKRDEAYSAAFQRTKRTAFNTIQRVAVRKKNLTVRQLPLLNAIMNGLPWKTSELRFWSSVSKVLFRGWGTLLLEAEFIKQSKQSCSLIENQWASPQPSSISIDPEENPWESGEPSLKIMDCRWSLRSPPTC